MSGLSSTGRYPFSVVWTPIPIVSWLLPWVGHVGVARSDGVVYDFAGHCLVNQDRLAFGAPAKVLPLQADRAAALRDQVALSLRNGGGKATLSSTWDDWLNFSAGVFHSRLYSFFTQNCHSFVAFFLNSIRYADSSGWNSVSLAWLMFCRSRSVSPAGFLRTWVPFCAVMLAGWHFWGAAFLLSWLALAASGVAWFLLHARCLASGSHNRILSV